MGSLFYFPDFHTEQSNTGFGFLMWQSKVKTGLGSGGRKIVDNDSETLKKRYWNKTLKKRYSFYALLILYLFFGYNNVIASRSLIFPEDSLVNRLFSLKTLLLGSLSFLY